MKSKFLPFFLLLLSTIAISQSNYSAETLEKIKEVENNITGNLILNGKRPLTLAQRMAKYKVKGLSIAVIYDYKIAWAKGYGWADEGEKKPVTPETLFEPGSISKTLNAVGILKLAQEKKVDLNTDINSYLKSWSFPYDSISHGKKITLAQILSHNAGLNVHGFPGHNIEGPIPTVYQVLDGESPAVTPAVRSEFEPGLRFQYSGGGITISQVLLTDVTGQIYDTWMYENVLKPIGMIHSSYTQPPTKEMQAICSSAYTKEGAPIQGKFHVYPEQAAAGLWMTPSDLCQYIIDMQLAYRGYPSKVLSPEMVQLHLTPYNSGPTAMGTFIQDHEGAQYFEHSAGNDGFSGDFLGSLEDGYGIVIFTNTEYGNLIPEVINSVAKAYHWKNFYTEPRHKKSINVSDKIIRNYEGIYLYDNSWAGIGKKDNEYRFYTNGIYAKMYFSKPTRFYNEEFQAEKEFIKDDHGNITGYTRTVNGQEFPRSFKVTNPDTLHLDNGLFSDISWYLFETKNYDEAIAYFKRGTQLYPADLNLLSNMAHTYLYSGDYNSAMAIYSAHLQDNIRPGYSWVEMMQDDLSYFQDHGYNIKVFDQVFEALNIPQSKGQ